MQNKAGAQLGWGRGSDKGGWVGEAGPGRQMNRSRELGRCIKILCRIAALRDRGGLRQARKKEGRSGPGTQLAACLPACLLAAACL